MMRALARSGSAHSFLTTAVSTAFSETAADRRQARLGRSRLPRGWSARTTARRCRASSGRRAAIPGRPRPSAPHRGANPNLGEQVDEPVQLGGHAAARDCAALDPSAAIVQRQRNVELVERGSAEPHVALDVDRPAPAAAQGLVQVSAQPTSQIREVRSVRRPALRPKHGREQAGDRCETPVLPLIRC